MYLFDILGLVLYIVYIYCYDAAGEELSCLTTTFEVDPQYVLQYPLPLMCDGQIKIQYLFERTLRLLQTV